MHLHGWALAFYVANDLSFRGSLDEAYAGDLSFADSLQAFGAGLDDPISVAIGGYYNKALMYLSLNYAISSYLHLALANH